MRFLLDANLPRSLAPRLEERGHDVVDIRDIAPVHWLSLSQDVYG